MCLTRSFDTVGDTCVFDPVASRLGELLGRDHENRAVGVMNDRVRHAAEHQRLDAAAAARAEHYQVRVHIGRHPEDFGRSVAMPALDSRSRQQPGVRTPLRTLGRGIDPACLTAASA